jgi:peptide/nickel transport system substrate-binding protein
MADRKSGNDGSSRGWALSRRRLLGAGSAGVAGTCMLGFRPIQALAQDKPAGAPSTPQTLVIGWASGPNGVDEEFNASLRSIGVYRNCGTNALRFNYMPVGQVFQDSFSDLILGEAKEYQLNDDWSKITITLKEGVLSPVGNELSTDDVVYRYQRNWALRGTGWGFIKDAMLLTEDSIVPENRYTYTVSMTGPNALAKLIQAHIGTVLWDSVEAKKNTAADDPWSTKWQSSNFVGHGPWQLTEYVAGESWTFERNPNYYDPARYTGNVTKVINRVIPSSANRVALVQSGAIDMAFDLQASELVQLQKAPGVRVDSLIGNHLQWLGFSFNTEVGKPLRDLNVRKAVAAALPFEQLLERPYLGLAQQMRTTVAPAYVGYDQVSKVWAGKYDPESAKKYIAESGYPDGFQTTLHYDIGQPGQEETAIIIKAALAAIGIDVEIVKVQTGDFFNLAFARDKGFPGLFIYRDMAGTPDVNFGTHLWLKSGHCCAPGGYANPEIDALYAEAQGSPGNLDLRIERQVAIDDIALNKDPMGVPMQAVGFHVACRENVGGFWWHSLNEVTWDRAWKA